jgi:beta-alanine degradation protein BauB
MNRLFWASVLLCLGANAVLAQDATKVAPTHYKLAFDNDRVQVIYIHYGPHEKSALHSHPGGVVVNISDGHLKFTDEHGNTQEVYAKRGEARWFPPFKHKVKNLSDAPYDAVYIAVRPNKPAARLAQK